MARHTESEKVRRWDGVVAVANDLDEERVWVVWGLAAPPEHAAAPDDDAIPEGGEPANDIAVAIAAGADPDFAAADDDHRWIVLVTGDEGDVDTWVLDHPVASGYAPYLIASG
jgi:hypothetical protein